MYKEFCVYRVDDVVYFKNKEFEVELEAHVKGYVYIEDGFLYPGFPRNPDDIEIEITKLIHKGQDLSKRDLPYWELDEVVKDNLDYEDGDVEIRLTIRDEAGKQIAEIAEDILNDDE